MCMYVMVYVCPASVRQRLRAKLSLKLQQILKNNSICEFLTRVPQWKTKWTIQKKLWRNIFFLFKFLPQPQHSSCNTFTNAICLVHEQLPILLTITMTVITATIIIIVQHIIYAFCHSFFSFKSEIPVSIFFFIYI